MAEENKQLENQNETFSIKELTFEPHLKTIIIDMGTGMNRMVRYPGSEFFGTRHLGIQHSTKYNSLNFGTGLLARPIFPGSYRLIFTGFSSSWTGFYISSMGEASLALDNEGLNLVIITGRAQQLFDLMPNHIHREKIQVRVESIAYGWKIWNSGRRDVHSRMNYVNERYGGEFEEQYRIRAIGPAALTTDFGEIVSVTAWKDEFTYVDTWSGRGGFGSKMLQEYNFAAVIYEGTYIDKNFRECSVTDKWFEDYYHKKLVAKKLEATTKFRFDRKFEAVGTLGVNFASMDGCTLTFNYQTPSWSEDERLASVNHYLKQFNEETIKGKQNWTCGEPCVAVCLKINNRFKKDYEPSQTMALLCGAFDQQAAELLNHHADDDISVGGVVSWLMEPLYKGLATNEEHGVIQFPLWRKEGLDIVVDSMHTARLRVELPNSFLYNHGIIDFNLGAKRGANKLARQHGRRAIDSFLYVTFRRRGGMIPNQNWTPSVLSPTPTMRKYYMYYVNDFMYPRILGRTNPERFKIDNLSLGRFHYTWTENIMPDVIEQLYGKDIAEKFQQSINTFAYKRNICNNSGFWKSYKNIDLDESFFIRKYKIKCDNNPDLLGWVDYLRRDRRPQLLNFGMKFTKESPKT
jgi:glyceraldehyde-3-phosphate dehydrogenase (ferredoxin)